MKQARYVIEAGKRNRAANARRDFFQRNFERWVSAPEVSRGLSEGNRYCGDVWTWITEVKHGHTQECLPPALGKAGVIRHAPGGRA